MYNWHKNTKKRPIISAIMNENHLFCVNTLIVLQQSQSTMISKRLTWKGKSIEGIRKRATLKFLKNCDFAKSRVGKQIKSCHYMWYLKPKVSKLCTFHNKQVYEIQEYNSFEQKYQKLWLYIGKFWKFIQHSNVSFWTSNCSINLRKT